MPYGTSVFASTGQRDSCVLWKGLVIDIVPKLLQGWAHKITPVIDSIAVVHLSGQRNKREYNSEHDHDVQLREHLRSGVDSRRPTVQPSRGLLKADFLFLPRHLERR